ncbi:MULTISPECIES: methyl-accepting chemotaxis protein [unclassified Undibacterium]|uniref:methyl-accepting chemotaxis protein n=1 Tax=unclassified Undibacterium TaxID=2630295 RepID=UPI002AC97E60|nr:MULTISPECIES: methyl-accepting chemotaxis protein [unclassified Undibacterium]MEB0141169.1 methyl-accepting chemotaxis protein [Undibacterium sp. CCC2.1]MEB0174202.1 methyl-accepting chemotaxis protein [Undibacterium sp. CCC1.1]MEB0178150.1 methyl-accepting chemotaxis protein [Undibacterium sp. CCC3.4]MEB0217355.1 methyl-accepting chemotaxis protein [Undibacterium sp. 5I2]WPX44700.1 methyl-accepting chemotaxis protein [Undibacterium sp. CCC3.4]
MTFLKDLKISAKLLIGFAFLLLLTSFIGLFAIYQLAQVNHSATELGTNWMPSVKVTMAIKERLSRIRSQEAQMVFAENPEEVEKYIKRTQEAVAGLKENEASYSILISEAQERALYAEYQQQSAAYLQLTEKMMALVRAGNAADAVAILRGDSSHTNTKLRELVDKLVTINAEGGTKAYQDSIVLYERSRLLILLVLALSIALGLGLAVFIARIVSLPLRYAVKVAQTVAAGDLTSQIDIHSRDETGMLLQALKEMNASLMQVVSEVRQGSDEITLASSEIAHGNMDLSNRTETQAGSLEETASSMEEITSTMQHNADNARQANQLSHSASEVAQRGGAVVAQVVDTMGAINAASKKIVDIIGVIDGIAFQTNILALNAAVEAARAGEQGRGFAVVASEVRNLAQRSASAAKEIKDLINASVDQVEQGTRLVDQAGNTMNEVVESVRRVSDIISEITAAGLQQSAGIAQINDAITEIDTITQQNAALVEEAAAAAASLQEQALRLGGVVSVFKLDGQSGGSATPRAARKAAAPKATSANNAAARPKLLAAQTRSVKAAEAGKKTTKAAQSAGKSDEWEEF